MLPDESFAVFHLALGSSNKDDNCMRCYIEGSMSNLWRISVVSMRERGPSSEAVLDE